MKTPEKTHELKIWHLSHLQILADRAMQDLDYLANVCHLSEIPKHSVIYLPGDPAETVYFLKQGRVRISRLSEEGKQITLLVLEAGSLFGEMAVLDDQAHHESIAETMENTLLCHTSKQNFEQFLQRNPDLSLKIAKLMGKRLRQVENRLEDVAFLPVEARLYKLLGHLAREYGQLSESGTRIQLRLTHQDLGQLIHATRQTVTELLNQFESAQLLSTERRQLVLHPRFFENKAMLAGLKAQAG